MKRRNDGLNGCRGMSRNYRIGCLGWAILGWLAVAMLVGIYLYNLKMM